MSFNISSAAYTHQCDTYDPENPSIIETETLARGSRISQELFSQSEEAKALLHHRETQKMEIASSNARVEKSIFELEITQAKMGLIKSPTILLIYSDSRVKTIFKNFHGYYYKLSNAKLSIELNE